MGLLPIFQTKEKREIECEVNNLDSGRGKLYAGKYYTLHYEPVHDQMDFKCTGVKLSMRPNPNAMYINHNFPNSPITVPFKSGTIFNRQPYSIRLKNAVSLCKQRINDVDILIDTNFEKKARAISEARVWELTTDEDREKAIKEHIKKINKCQIRIDATMKKIVPEAEPTPNSPKPKVKQEPINPRIWVPVVMPDDNTVDDCPLTGHAGIAGYNPKN